MTLEPLLRRAANGASTDRIPTVVGTGLIALDVVLHEQAPSQLRLHAGGTCGNVLAILSYLGWSAYPVARMNGDPASKTVRKDLERWGVNLDYAGTLPSGNTPVIVQNIKRSASGHITHSFSWHCPACGTDLPRYLPVHTASARKLTSSLESTSVFFTDRISSASLILARACASYGGIVVFEPSAIGDYDQFLEMLCLAHIVKYSQDRLPLLSSILDGLPLKHVGIRLEIETMGARGLRYRVQRARMPLDVWQTSVAFHLEEVRDTCGAGDWTTAGIISKLGVHGAKGFVQATESEVAQALRFGQALGAWNCAYYGARGGMYRTSRQQMESNLKYIIEGSTWKCPVNDVPEGDSQIDHAAATFCPHCSQSSS